jgi:predicted helicase
MWGSQQEKYDGLSQEDVSSTLWKPIVPATPFYLFMPIRTEWLQEYNLGWRITDAMPVHSVGIVSGRDELTMKLSSKEILRTVKQFSSLSEEEARERFKLGKDARDWKVSLAQKDVVETGISEQSVAEVLYRPFDVRFTFYTGKTKGFLCMPMYEVMRHMLAGKNIGLSTTKSIEIGRGWEHIFCSSRPIQHHTVSLKEVNYLFPLYLYPRSGDEGKYARSTLIQDAEKAIKDSGRTAAKDVESERDRVAQLIKRLLPEERYPRVPNLNPDFINEIESRLNISFVPDGTGDLQSSFGPEDILRYIYSILHSPTYRVRYSEFLRSDFPRIPLVSDVLIFRSLCSLGKELVELHLLSKDGPWVTSYPIQGDHLVDQVRYSEPGQGDEEGRVWINKTQYFKGIPPEVWDFHVGGYQICEKWLKDRKGRKLSFDDLAQYQKIVSALAETIRIMGEIDAVIEYHGGFPIQ